MKLDNGAPPKSTALTTAQESAAAAASAEVQAAIMVALKFPRDEARAQDKLMKTCESPAFANVAEYGYPRGGEQITGPSVNMAREAARVFGNIRYGVDVVHDDDKLRTLRGWAWDLETNTKISFDDTFAKLIFRKKGGWIVPDERDLRELTNRRAAFLERNCILKLIPKHIIDEAMDACARTRVLAAKADPQALAKMVKAFEALKPSVTVDDLVAYLKHPLDDTTHEEVAALQPIWKSIKDGNSKWSEYVAPAAAAPNGEPVEEKVGFGSAPVKEEEQEQPVTIIFAPLQDDAPALAPCHNCGNEAKLLDGLCSTCTDKANEPATSKSKKNGKA